MNTLKKMISRYMHTITWIIVSIILVAVVSLQVLEEQQRAQESAAEVLYQIEVRLEENQKEIVELVEEYSRTCLHKAEAIACILQDNTWALESVDELREIAGFMEVDAIHIIDETGRVVSGTNPEYYDYTFDSGEQIGFFKPMLEDKSLKLVQEITPNSSEGKLMQYSALWSENGEFIVQVGMEPVRVAEATAKNEVSYIISLLNVNSEAQYYAINAAGGEIVGATNPEFIGKDLTTVGFDAEILKNDENGFHAKINGTDSYCVFRQIGTNYIGRIVANDVLYQRIPGNMISLAICLILVAVVLSQAVIRYMNRYVVDGIHDVNEKLRTITKGNLGENVDIQNSVEFSELSNHINEMIRSLLANNKKMSYVLSKTKMYIGVYEYNEHMKNVRCTEYVSKVLSIDADELEWLSSDYKVFKAYIQKIYDNPVPGEKGVFRLNSKRERYVRLEEINENNEVFGVIIDVSREIIKRRQIERERDIDSLTGLYNRRGMENRLSELFSEPEKLGYSALIMIDADGLKEINDEHGHEMGDAYLKKVSEVINNFGMKSCMAARPGGDEFVLFLYEYDKEKELIDTINLLGFIQNNSTAYLSDDLTVPLKFSYGYSLVKEGTDYQILMNEADERMYENKRQRKNAKGV